jgi:post-segregation antitoxin (ccd killing protein)
MTAAVALDKKKLWKEINREERAKKRALLVELRGQISDDDRHAPRSGHRTLRRFLL